MEHGFVPENNEFDFVEMPIKFEGFEEIIMQETDLKTRILKGGFGKFDIQNPSFHSNKINADFLAHLRVKSSDSVPDKRRDFRKTVIFFGLFRFLRKS